MRTEAEILARIEKKKVFMDFFTEVAVDYLSFEAAKPFLKDTATREEWKQLTDPVVKMKDYMSFAWLKASSHRGLSAMRSISKMQAWLWLLEDDELLAFAELDSSFTNYGAPILLAICEKYGFTIPDDDPGVLRMASGLPCKMGCDEGCAG